MDSKKERKNSGKETERSGEKIPAEEFQMSETWAHDALQDLEDFIEEQGIYIRQ